jgi:2,5-diketo-D-gluconate reductase B
MTKYVDIQGEKVPSVGLGTWQLTGNACTSAVKLALGMGYRHIDTAQIYDNESEVGKGIAESGIRRGEIFLTTKIWVDNLEPELLKESFAASLKKLRTDYVDLLLIHWPSRTVPLKDSLKAMASLVKEGKVRHIGVSNFNIRLMEEATSLEKIFTNQIEYHPYLAQDRLVSYAQHKDLMLTAYSPLARGRLVGDRVLGDIAESHKKTIAQVALRWLIQQKNVVVIPKASSEGHLRSNFDIFDFKLTPKEMDRINSLARGHRVVAAPSLAPEWD